MFMGGESAIERCGESGHDRPRSFIPYGRQWIEEKDIDAVVEVLLSDWLTQRPTIERFEEALCTILKLFLGPRREIAASYDRAFPTSPMGEFLQPLALLPGRWNAYHLYVVRLLRQSGENLERLSQRRKDLSLFLRNRRVFTQVHYIPVNWHPYYRIFHGANFEDCPVANAYYAGCLSLPIYPQMGDGEVDRVVETLQEWSGSKRSQIFKGAL